MDHTSIIMLLLTVIILCVLSFASYYFFDKDFFSPPTVVCLGFVFACLSCMYNEKTWGIDYSVDTMHVIVFGVSAFVAGGFLSIIISNYSIHKNIGFTHVSSSISIIKVSRIKLFLVIALDIGTIILLYVELRNLTGNTNWFQIVSTYRQQIATVNPLEYTMRLSSICSTMIEVCFAFAFVFSYIVGNNIAAGGKHLILNSIPVVFSSIISFMQGQRFEMFRLWIAILVVSYVLKKRKYGWKKGPETKRTVIRIILSGVVVAFAFSALRGMVGRAETDWNPLYYITFYAGTSIAALDLFIKNPLPPSGIWGKETFYYTNQSLGAYLDKPELRYVFYKEFRLSPNGTVIGNVYTALRPPYYDFGFLGMIIVMFIMGLFFSYVYIKVRDKKGKSQIDLRLLLYSNIAFTFFMYFYNLYNMFLTVGFIKFIIEMIVIRWFILDFDGLKTKIVKPL